KYEQHPLTKNLDNTLLIALIFSLSVLVSCLIPIARCAWLYSLSRRTEPVERMNDQGQLELIQSASDYPKQQRTIPGLNSDA
ncbi:hypothetical protein PENTCL1PPCAC_5899, partial [Pristionchus entomophagus]